jgi:hypothetical protein
VHDHLTQFKDAIQNNFGHQQYRDLQTLLSQNKDSEVEDWLKTNGYSKDKKIREYVRENLRNWFKKEKWKRIDTQGNIKGDCGTMPKGKKTQRCLPAAKAKSLTKKQRAATSRKKTKSNKQFVSNTKAAKVKLKK